MRHGPGEADLALGEAAAGAGAQEQDAQGLALHGERHGGQRGDAPLGHHLLDLAQQRVAADVVHHHRAAGAHGLADLRVAGELDAHVLHRAVVAGGDDAALVVLLVDEHERAAIDRELLGQPPGHVVQERRHVQGRGVVGGQVEQDGEVLLAARLVGARGGDPAHRLEAQVELAVEGLGGDEAVGAQGERGQGLGVVVADDAEHREVGEVLLLAQGAHGLGAAGDGQIDHRHRRALGELAGRVAGLRQPRGELLLGRRRQDGCGAGRFGWQDSAQGEWSLPPEAGEGPKPAAGKTLGAPARQKRPHPPTPAPLAGPGSARPLDRPQEAIIRQFARHLRSREHLARGIG